MSETSRLNGLSDWYLKEQTDFDKRMIRFRFETIKAHLQGPNALELGPAEGEMTQFLVPHFEHLTVVEGGAALLSQMPDWPNVAKVNSLFEDYEPQTPFNTIIMEHILEHVESPAELLKRTKRWLVPGGRIIVGVPNGNSIHRLVAVKMGLLDHPCELNARDLALGHRRVYTMETLQADIHSADLMPIHFGGVFFKPLSNAQIQSNWSEEMILGFYELGKDFPQYAAELFAVTVAS